MHASQFARPSPALESFVRFYVQRQARIPSGATVIHPVPARPTPMIVFDFADPTDVLYYRQPRVVRSPLSVIVGPQTYRRLEMQLRGALDTFAISFRPDGISRLFAIPMQQLTDSDFEAHSVLGTFITKLGERLGNAKSFPERVREIEKALLPRALASPYHNGVSEAANRIILGRGRAAIPALAGESGLSLRQFERRFIQQVGIRPKLFARIARFEAALEDKARFSTKSWTDVAYEFGYYDQMHMVHDFAEFTGATPTETLYQLETVFVEQIMTMRSGGRKSAADADQRLIL